VRAFDFSYDVGHGIRRNTRHYSVAVMETDVGLGDVLMWHKDDAAGSSLEAAQAWEETSSWRWRGDRQPVHRLARSCVAVASVGASIQTIRGMLMIFAPSVGLGDTYEHLLTAAGDLCQQLAPSARTEAGEQLN